MTTQVESGCYLVGEFVEFGSRCEEKKGLNVMDEVVLVPWEVMGRKFVVE